MRIRTDVTLPGTIGFCTSGYARVEGFWRSLTQLQIPNGTNLVQMRGTGIANNFNDIVRQVRPDDRWLFLLADDHTFPPDLLLRLLERATAFRCPILIPLVMKKEPPYDSVLFQDDGVPLDFQDLKGDEPVPVWAAGLAGAVIDTQVIRAMKYPWFRHGWQEPDSAGEDTWFCRQAAQAGFQVYVDPTLRMGHVPAEIAVEPIQRDGEWFVRFTYPDGKWFQLPLPRPERGPG